MYISDKRYFLARDGKTVVTEEDPTRFTLLAAKGSEVTAEVARKIGLIPAEGTAQASQGEPASQPVGKDSGAQAKPDSASPSPLPLSQIDLGDTSPKPEPENGAAENPDEKAARVANMAPKTPAAGKSK